MPEDLHAAVRRIDATVETALAGLTLDGLKERFIQAARKDLAGRALSAGEGYTRRVDTFRDLTRAELDFVEAWIGGVDLPAELRRLAWLPAPAPQRIVRLLQEDPDIPLRPRQKLIERFIDAS